MWDWVPVFHVPLSGLPFGGSRGGGCPAEVVAHTDADFTGGSFTIQAGIVEDEIAAASFTVDPSHFPLIINTMEMIFAQNHFNETTTQWSVLIWEGNPETGNLIDVFMSDDVILPHLTLPLGGSNGANIQVSIDPGDPEQILLNDDGSHTFSVGYRIDQHNQPATSSCACVPGFPSLGTFPAVCCPAPAASNAFPTTDVSGVANAAGNWLYARDCPGATGVCPSVGQWYQFNEPGLPSGDWVLRVTYTPLSCVGFGACCLTNGTCQSLQEPDCLAQGGTWFDGQGCNPSPCPQLGACCDDVTATCSDGVFEADCTGRWVENAFCAELGNPNVHPAECGNGACCGNPTNFPPDGCAENVDAAVCAAFLGVFHLGAACSEINDCLDVRACCFPPDSCSDLTEWQCSVAGGQWSGPGTDCGTTICFPAGACCYPDGTCSDGVPEGDCLAAGGIFQGDAVLCSSVQCPQPLGACCLANGSCLDLQESSCIGIPGASWAGPFTDCTDADTNGTADICEASTPGVVNFYSCAVQCSAGDAQQLPNCPDDPVHRYCLRLYDPPAGGGRGAGDPREDTRIEPRFFTSSNVFDLELSGPPSGSVTVSADCTDGNVYLAGAVSLSSDGMTVTAQVA
ncbi:MAG: hypothetical protein IID40_06730, partial [Planctomycetes bacterium]|nr:hypothetical protein [Planctomycetota bacterium]